MFCNQCGAKVNDDAKYCFNCGGKIDNLEISKIPTQENTDDKVSVEKAQEIVESDELRKEQQKNINEKIDIKFSREMTFMDVYIYFKGAYFVENYIQSLLTNVALKAERASQSIKVSADSALSRIVSLITEFAELMSRKLEQVESYFCIAEQSTYYEMLEDYVDNKLLDILAVNEACKEIEQGVDMKTAYRSARKACRGRWIGGGFGLKGALTGAAQAGALNAGTGAVHSMVNLIGNTATYIKATNQRESLIRQINNSIPKEVNDMADKFARGYIGILKTLHPEIFYSVNSVEEGRIKAIISQGFCEDSRRLGVKLLKINPYNLENYQLVYNIIRQEKMIDIFKDNIKKLIEISEWFNIDFVQWLKELLQKKLIKIEISAINLQQLISIESLIYCDDKDIKKYDHSLLAACQKQIREDGIENIDIKVSVLAAFCQKYSQKKFLEDYQGLLSYDINAANVHTQTDFTTKGDMAIRQVYAQKKLAVGKNIEKLDSLISAYVLHIASDWLEAADLSESSEVIRLDAMVSNLDKTYDCHFGRDELNRRVLKHIEDTILKVEYKPQMNELEKYMRNITQNTSLEITNIEERVEKGYKRVKTVLGVEYATFEEAERERRRTVGSKKFYSEEDADRERELIRREMNLMDELEKRGLSEIELLKAIKQQYFRSDVAKEKEAIYDEKIISLYKVLKSQNISQEIAKKKFLRIACIPLGILTVIIGIGPFLSAGWLMKIVIAVIATLPWGWSMMFGDELKKLIGDQVLLQKIEMLFIIQDQQIYLKNGYEQDNQKRHTRREKI